MTKITSIEAIPVEVPRLANKVVPTAYGTIRAARFVIVVVKTDDGIEGFGEASPEDTWTGETRASCFHCITEYFHPALVGHDAHRVQEAVHRMDRAIARNPSAKSAVEMALWDVVGKLANLSVADLWGGPVRDRIPVKFVVSGQPEEAAAMAIEALESGFRYIKIKVGFDPADDIARVRSVREAIGDDVPILVDANQGWSLNQALALLPALAEARVSFIEQPVPRHPLEALIEFRRLSSIPVVAHESVFTLNDAYTLAVNRAADIWALTPSTHGGYLKTRDILGIAQAAHVPCVLGTTYELGIGTAFLLHIAASSPNIDGTVPSDVRGQFYYESDLVEEKLELESGAIRPPHGVGLGVNLDRAALERYRADGC